jgi:hypothetical protein
MTEWRKLDIEYPEATAYMKDSPYAKEHGRILRFTLALARMYIKDVNQHQLDQAAAQLSDEGKLAQMIEN